MLHCRVYKDSLPVPTLSQINPDLGKTWERYERNKERMKHDEGRRYKRSDSPSNLNGSFSLFLLNSLAIC